MQFQEVFTFILALLGTASVELMLNMLRHHEVKHHHNIFFAWTVACGVITICGFILVIMDYDTEPIDVVLTVMFGINSVTSHVMRHYRMKRERLARNK